MSPEEQESQEEMEKADAASLHQSVTNTFKDEEYEQSRWLIHPNEYIAISLPESKAKPIREYNYLGPRARRAVKEMITDLFKIDLWASLKDIADRSCKLHHSFQPGASNMALALIMRIPCANASTECAISTQKKGINLNSTTRFHKD